MSKRLEEENREDVSSSGMESEKGVPDSDDDE